ncbi:hypothetical protein [Williamsoniiplasma lucivorax]|uniref:Lipoprotein n=1 Tax=Williamsoniiplasma lucivorax TaxID=209274 RepID=A0A2S5RFD8_9MOLU|nr:hypothetical protein [Williamsoniiplasma lucivorax]PPE05845.1 hypothetical protein ELUCI_v1c01330 [Williamsoniiplasma lucivorax]
MKKLLMMLGSVLVAAASTSTIVACSCSPHSKNNTRNGNQMQRFNVDLGILGDITPDTIIAKFKTLNASMSEATIAIKTGTTPTNEQATLKINGSYQGEVVVSYIFRKDIGLMESLRFAPGEPSWKAKQMIRTAINSMSGFGSVKDADLTFQGAGIETGRLYEGEITVQAKGSSNKIKGLKVLEVGKTDLANIQLSLAPDIPLSMAKVHVINAINRLPGVSSISEADDFDISGTGINGANLAEQGSFTIRAKASSNKIKGSITIELTKANITNIQPKLHVGATLLEANTIIRAAINNLPGVGFVTDNDFVLSGDGIVDEKLAEGSVTITASNSTKKIIGTVTILLAKVNIANLQVSLGPESSLIDVRTAIRNAMNNLPGVSFIQDTDFVLSEERFTNGKLTEGDLRITASTSSNKIKGSVTIQVTKHNIANLQVPLAIGMTLTNAKSAIRTAMNNLPGVSFIEDTDFVLSEEGIANEKLSEGNLVITAAESSKKITGATTISIVKHNIANLKLKLIPNLSLAEAKHLVNEKIKTLLDVADITDADYKLSGPAFVNGNLIEGELTITAASTSNLIKGVLTIQLVKADITNMEVSIMFGTSLENVKNLVRAELNKLEGFGFAREEDYELTGSAINGENIIEGELIISASVGTGKITGAVTIKHGKINSTFYELIALAEAGVFQFNTFCFLLKLYHSIYSDIYLWISLNFILAVAKWFKYSPFKQPKKYSTSRLSNEFPTLPIEVLALIVFNLSRTL